MSDKVTGRQKKFIAAMMTCRNVTDAAALAGIARQTCYKWLDDPHVKAALSEAQDAALAASTRQLVNAMQSAIDTLESIHTDGEKPASSRVAAARAILDSGLKYAELVDLAKRVTELETRLST